MLVTHAEAHAQPVRYAESDGQPMGETQLHVDETMELILALRDHFHARALRDSVAVLSNLFVYYEEGNPRAVFCPDVMVVRGLPQSQPRTYKLWCDGPSPTWILEVSSKSTSIEDRGNKKAVCELLGVAEYFLYDPTEDYLHPPLQAWRLRDGRYEPIALDDRGRLLADSLGLSFSIGGNGLLEVWDAESGLRLLRHDEQRERAVRTARERDSARDEARRERDRALAAERRLAELERKLAGG